jgi:hypothetical protein
MEHKEQIKFRKLLKKNGFVKSDTSILKDLMEFVKGEQFSDNCIIVYTYETVDAHFYIGSNCCDWTDCVITTIKEFADIYKQKTNQEFIVN